MQFQYGDLDCCCTPNHIAQLLHISVFSNLFYSKGNKCHESSGIILDVVYDYLDVFPKSLTLISLYFNSFSKNMLFLLLTGRTAAFCTSLGTDINYLIATLDISNNWLSYTSSCLTDHPGIAALSIANLWSIRKMIKAIFTTLPKVPGLAFLIQKFCIGKKLPMKIENHWTCISNFMKQASNKNCR